MSAAPPMMGTARPQAKLLNLTMQGLSPEDRQSLEAALVAASKSGRFLISVFTLLPEDGNPMLILKSLSVKSSNFPVSEFNLCQDHFHQHLASMAVSSVGVQVAEAVPAANEGGDTKNGQIP